MAGSTCTSSSTAAPVRSSAGASISAPQHGGHLLCRARAARPRRPARDADDRDGQRQPVHLAGVPPPPLRPGCRPPAGWLPRSRVPGLQRVLVRAVQEALRLARRVGEHRPRPPRDHRLHRHLPPPAPLRDRLPHPRRGRPDLADPTNPSDLTRQRQRGPRHPCHKRARTPPDRRSIRSRLTVGRARDINDRRPDRRAPVRHAQWSGVR